MPRENSHFWHVSYAANCLREENKKKFKKKKKNDGAIREKKLVQQQNATECDKKIAK